MEIDYEIISLYLDGKLSLEQNLEFEKKLETDEVFKKEYDLYIDVQNTLSKKYNNEQKVEDLKKSLKEITTPEIQIEEKTQSKTFIESNLFKIIALAAVFAIGFFIMKPETSLYNQYAQHNSLEVQVKGENEALLLEDMADYCLVVGDVTSTMACSIAAKKLGVLNKNLFIFHTLLIWGSYIAMFWVITSYIKERLLFSIPFLSCNTTYYGTFEI